MSLPQHADGGAITARLAARAEPVASTAAPSSPARPVSDDAAAAADDCRRRPKGLIVGQAPNAGASAEFVPLSGLAERRLARLAGVEVHELWQRFERRNLLDGHPGRKPRAEKHTARAGYRLHQSSGDEFPMEQARAAAVDIDVSDYRLVVLLGLSVANAFQLPRPRLLTLDRDTLPCPTIVLPHTSGVSHFWNDPANVQLAECAFRAAIAECLCTRSRFFGASDARPGGHGGDPRPNGGSPSSSRFFVSTG